MFRRHRRTRAVAAVAAVGALAAHRRPRRRVRHGERGAHDRHVLERVHRARPSGARAARRGVQRVAGRRDRSRWRSRRGTSSSSGCSRASPPTRGPISSPWTPPSCRSTSPAGRSARSTTTTRTRRRSPTRSVQAAVDATKWDGVAYGVPMNFTTLLLYWNKDAVRGGRARSRGATGDVGGVRRLRRAVDRRRPVRPGDRRQQHGPDVADPAVGQRRRCRLRRRHDLTARRPRDDRGARLLGRPRRATTGSRRSGSAAPTPTTCSRPERAAMEIVGPWMTTGFTEAGIDFGLAPPPAGPAGPVTLGTSVAFAINARVRRRHRRGGQGVHQVLEHHRLADHVGARARASRRAAPTSRPTPCRRTPTPSTSAPTPTPPSST